MNRKTPIHAEPGHIGSFDDFQEKAEQGLGPIDDPLLVATIHEAFKQVGQEDEQADEHEMAAACVGDATGMRNDRQEFGNIRHGQPPRSTYRTALTGFVRSSRSVFAGPTDVLGFEKTFDAAYQA